MRLVAFALVGLTSSIASADDEASEQTIEIVAAPGARAKLSLSFSQPTPTSRGEWRYELVTSTKTRSGPLPRIPGHAHLVAFLPDRGDRFVVVDTSAGHRHHDRVLVYDRGGKLVKAFGFADFLTKAERARLDLSN